MGIFSKLKNYNEYPLKVKKIQTGYSEVDPTPSITELKNGDYKAKWYGYTFELEDGTKYKTIYGVRTSSNRAQYKDYKVFDGKILERKNSRFSGYAEIGGAMQGMSYGRKPLPGENVTRIEMDKKGFKIPDGIAGHFNIEDKKFSLGTKPGEFKGGVPDPIVGISKDNSIIRKTGPNGMAYKFNRSAASDQPNVMTNTILDWNQDQTFHLGIEPWVTAPLISDIQDGIYVGNVQGDQLAVGDKRIIMSIKLATEYPESVIALIKNKKIYLFKQSQMAKTTGSRIFSEAGPREKVSQEMLEKAKTEGVVQKYSSKLWGIISIKAGEWWNAKYDSKENAEAALKAYQANKHFSEITSDDQFRDYAHNLMKNAHKDNYDQIKTDKVVDDLLKNHSGSDYGELIGRLKSGLGNKSYADPQSPEEAQQLQAQQSQQAASAPLDPNAQQDPQLLAQQLTEQANQTAQQIQQSQQQLVNLANKGQEQVHAQAELEKQKIAETIMAKDETNYTFDIKPSEPVYRMDAVIGTVALSVSLSHIFHWCQTDYPSHKALQEYYEKMPELIDDLAENYLETTKIANFLVCIVPQSINPIEYFTRLKDYCEKYQRMMLHDESRLSSLMDSITSLIGRTLYKLKRLSNGKRIFSLVEDRQFSKNQLNNSWTDKIDGDKINKLVESIVNVIQNYWIKYQKSPVKDIKTNDEGEIRQFVRKKLFSSKDISDFIAGLFDTIGSVLWLSKGVKFK